MNLGANIGMLLEQYFRQKLAEVKCNARNFDHKAFREKVEHISNKILAGYEIETRLFAMEDM